MTSLAITGELVEQPVLPWRQERAAFIARKRAIVEELKLARGCIDCGYNAHPRALQFDHRPGVEKRGIIPHFVSSGTSMATLLTEIDKCDVRCANCHAVKTAERPSVERRARRRLRVIP